MDGHISVASISGTNEYSTKLGEAMTRAISENGKINQEILSLFGMSGKKYRYFINNLIESIADPRYLEVGVYMGSTLCSAMYGNNLKAFAIDNWSTDNAAATQFFENIARFRTPEVRVSFLDSDFRAVDFSSIGKFNVYLFDGPHSVDDHVDGICVAMPALDDQFVLIIDDWNWADVRTGTFEAIRKVGLRLDFVAEIRTTLDESHPLVAGGDSDWHNGYFIAACTKA